MWLWLRRENIGQAATSQKMRFDPIFFQTLYITPGSP
jgi:hypothetical protein